RAVLKRLVIRLLPSTIITCIPFFWTFVKLSLHGLYGKLALHILEIKVLYQFSSFVHHGHLHACKFTRKVRPVSINL
ncbi:MAG: hypothetical protein SPD44_12250, partial [Prevotella sp.]|nr:hypothetical protein [Prevotella sp.]